VPSLSIGGAERLAVDICNELAKKEAEVTLLNFRDEMEYHHLSPCVRREVIPTRFIPSILGKQVKDYVEFEKFVSGLNPHIIHSHLFEAEIITRQILLKSAAYVTHLHDNMPQFRNFSLSTLLKKSRFTNYYEKRLIIRRYRQCRNNFIAISNDTANYFRACLPEDLRSRITVLHNAINFSRFYREGKKKLQEPYRLVTTGSLVDKKNQSFLVDVVKILDAKGVNVHLDILGEGPNRQKIRQKIIGSGLDKHITLHGNVERVEDYLHQSQIYVHPAVYEPFGLAILEAMAAGLPCVMLDGHGNRDIAEDGRNGFLVKIPSPRVFAEHVEHLIRTPGLYEEMSGYAVSFAKKFDIKEYGVKLLDFYHSIVEKSEVPGYCKLV